MRRVSVVGNSGSGKTFTARIISERLGLPHLELDAVHHQPGWAIRPDSEMRAIVADSWLETTGWSTAITPVSV